MSKILMFKKIYINSIGYVAEKLDNIFMYSDNKFIQNTLQKIAFYIFNFRVKNGIYD